jgi:hypothetical protein
MCSDLLLLYDSSMLINIVALAVDLLLDGKLGLVSVVFLVLEH